LASDKDFHHELSYTNKSSPEDRYLMCFTCLEIFRAKVFIFTSDVLREPCFKNNNGDFKKTIFNRPDRE